MSISWTRRFSKKTVFYQTIFKQKCFRTSRPAHSHPFLVRFNVQTFFFLLQNIFTQSKNVFTISRKQSSFSCLVFYDRTIFWKYFNIEFNNAWWLKKFLLTLSHFLCKVSTCLKLESLKIEGKNSIKMLECTFRRMN